MRKTAKGIMTIVAGVLADPVRHETPADAVAIEGGPELAGAGVWYILKTVTHPRLREPIKSDMTLEATNVNALVKKLKVTPKQACDLKHYGRTSWLDERGGTITLEISSMNEKENHGT